MSYEENKYIEVIDMPGSNKTYYELGWHELITSEGHNKRYEINTEKDHEYIFDNNKKVFEALKIKEQLVMALNKIEQALKK